MGPWEPKRTLVPAMKEGVRKNVLNAARMADVARIPREIATAARSLRAKAQPTVTAARITKDESKDFPRVLSR